MSMNRRPNPTRSGYDTWAPIATPWSAAAAHAARRVDGSPAWKPQATLALVTMSSIASSSPRRHTPNDSPRSLLRSMRTAPIVEVRSSRSGPRVDERRRATVAAVRSVRRGRLRARRCRAAWKQRRPFARARIATSSSLAGISRSGPPSAATPSLHGLGQRQVARSDVSREPIFDRLGVAAEHGDVLLVHHRAVVQDVEHLVAGGHRARLRPRGSRPPSASSRG